MFSTTKGQEMEIKDSFDNNKVFSDFVESSTARTVRRYATTYKIQYISNVLRQYKER